MYLDSESNVTVGKGTLLPNAAAAAALAFRHRDEGDLASQEEIRDEYAVLDAMTNDGNYSAAHYAQFTALYLARDEIDRLVVDHMRGDFSGLLRLFPYFGNYPEEVQIALWDMAYNLGLGNLENLFPRFIRAVVEEDWETAAQESHRTGIGEERNDYVRDLFLAAAGAVADGEADGSSEGE